MKIYKEAMLKIPSKMMDAFIRWRIRGIRNTEKQHLGIILNHQRIYKRIKADREELEGLLKKEGNEKHI